MKKTCSKGLLVPVLFLACIGPVSLAMGMGAEEDSVWTKAGREVKEASSAVGEATKESAKEAWKTTREGSAELYDKTKEFGSDAWEKTKTGAGEAWDATKDTSKSAWDKTREGSRELWESGKSRLHEATSPDPAPEAAAGSGGKEAGAAVPEQKP